MVHNLLKKGTFEVYDATQNCGKVAIEKRQGSLNQLHGILGFIDIVDLRNRDHAEEPEKAPDLSSSELMYRRFLIYKMFFAAEAPVIICEGETLAGTTAQGKIILKVRFYKYRRSSTARITGLDGGSGCLKTFISMYKKETAKFTAPGEKNPIIILYDNDSGAPGIRSVIKQVSGKVVNGTEPFVHVVRNLYAVPTPLLNGAQESKVEDFFEAAVKASVVGGKTFDPGSKFDTATHYGKKIFAYGVVRPGANSINFTGFRPLLSNLVSVIKSHAAAAAKVAPPIGATS
jgi:hypothetical protein